MVRNERCVSDYHLRVSHSFLGSFPLFLARLMLPQSLRRHVFNVRLGPVFTYNSFSHTDKNKLSFSKKTRVLFYAVGGALLVLDPSRIHDDISPDILELAVCSYNPLVFVPRSLLCVA